VPTQPSTFSDRYRRTVLDPMLDNNPITVQILGLCSALAVTSALRPALYMSLAVIGVLVFSNVSVSLLRRYMPRSIRLIIEVTLIASAVIVVDQLLRAFAPDVSGILSVFVGLIITNCIVLARVETYAMHNSVFSSALDGLGNGFGYSWVLIFVGFLRELFGSGSLLGYPVLPLVTAGGWFRPNELMLLTPSAFFIIGLLVWLVRSRRRPELDSSKAPAAERQRGGARG
jgi:Na+-transporting NADH:ubiquinone oxidoreductase subunit D